MKVNKYIVLIIELFFVLLLPLTIFAAGYAPQPTPAYSRYVQNAKVVVTSLFFFLHIFAMWFVYSFISDKRKWQLTSRLRIALSLYSSVISILAYIYIYFLASLQTGNPFDIYSNPIYLVYLFFLIATPYFWGSFLITSLTNWYILPKFIKNIRVTFTDMFICSILQTPFLGVILLYLITHLYFNIFPFNGIRYLPFR